MFPILLIIIMRKLKNKKAFPFHRILKRKKSLIAKVIIIYFAIAFQVSKDLYAQEKSFCYKVIRNGESKGVVWIREKEEGSSLLINVESEVKIRLLVTIIVKSVEQSSFVDGVLVRSSICRTVNGEEKINQTICADGGSYRLTTKNEKLHDLPYPIRYNVLCLYYQEPVRINKAYSDSFSQYVPISRVDSCRYRVDFPNGNHNYYTYKNGICTHVDVNQPFYELQFVLIQ